MLHHEQSARLLAGMTLLMTAAAAAETDLPVDFDRPMVFSVNPVGNGDFIGATNEGSDFVAYQDLVFQRCSEIGSRSARVLASWREVEASPGVWNWSSLDGEIAKCEKYGITPVVLICNIPGWVSPTGKPTHDHPPKEEYAEQFNTFITTMAKRYKGRAKHYEFWNEQNGCSWINDGCRNGHMAHTYLPWLYRCFKAIKAVDPTAKVAIGGLDNADGHSPIWVEQAYKLRKEQYNDEDFWDAIADHPYDKKPDAPISVFEGKINAIREIAHRYGHTDVEIWLTEYGWNAVEMGLEPQTAGTERFLERFVKDDMKDLVIAQQLAIADFESVHRGWGLCNLNLRPNPAFYEFQRMARQDVPTPMEFAYRILPDGGLKVLGKLMPSRTPMKVPTFLDIINEQGGLVASKQIRPFKFEVSFSRVPRDVPLLAVIRSEKDGKRLAPVARMPVIVPGVNLTGGDFEGLFRAGIPWAWQQQDQAIWRNGGSAGDQYRHAGNKALMLILFDSADPRSFDDRIQIPVAAREGEQYRVSWQAKYFGQEKKDAYILMSARLIDKEPRLAGRTAGQLVGRNWTAGSMVLRSPSASPLLVLQAVSNRLTKGTWLLCIDDVKMEPINGR